MSTNHRHRLGCLIALGYPMLWISARVGTDVGPWRHPDSPDPDPEHLAAFHALYRELGERVAEAGRIGVRQAAVTEARSMARRWGYLPPMAYEQDDDGNDVLADPSARRFGTHKLSERTRDRADYDRLLLLRELLAFQTLTLTDCARRVSAGAKPERTLYPIRVSDLRDPRPSPVRQWTRPVLCKALLGVVEDVRSGFVDPTDGWAAAVALYFAEFPERVPAKQRETAAA